MQKNPKWRYCILNMKKNNNRYSVPLDKNSYVYISGDGLSPFLVSTFKEQEEYNTYLDKYRKDKNQALLNMKHPNKLIQRYCKRVLNGGDWEGS